MVPSPSTPESAAVRLPRSRKVAKFLALYGTMVLVSTVTIFLLEPVSLVNAMRTALVAAIGKTIAAQWVSGWFD